VRTYTHTVADIDCTIHFPERRDDLDGFEKFLANGDRVLAFDTETSGLDIFTPGHRLRLVQIGNDREAWVLRADLFADDIARALRQPRRWVAHNAPYDLLVLDRHLGVRVEELGPRVFDTRILAHLLDPRAESEGGSGHRLKGLAEIYVDPDAPDTERGLTAEFRRLNLTQQTGWANIPIDTELYVRYAGLDVILARRLFDALGPIVREADLTRLANFEHHLQILLTLMQRKGMRLDVPYVTYLRDDLRAEAERYRKIAATYGVDNINSTTQVAEALLAMGETLDERTPSGKVKVDRGTLLPLADLDMQWQRIGARDPNPLADAVLRGKRAEKWAVAYADAFLELMDDDGRLHPVINGLQARTARMSVSRPPLQQLPSSDWRIRRAFIADPGQVIIAADYQAVEMRVLAALADVPKMKEAIRNGEDLHAFTARAVLGDDTWEALAKKEGIPPGEEYSPSQKKYRKLYKGVGFGKVYGGGAATLARQTGADIESVKYAIAQYDAVFPEIKRFARQLMRRAEYGRCEVVTPSGRHLPLDRDRLYAATNYVVQSTSRDLLAQAIVDIWAAGLGDHLLLPMHDELIAQAPRADAEEVIREIGRIMSRASFFGVPITSTPEVYGPSWGHGYGAPD